MRDIIIATALTGSLPERAYPSMRFNRVGDVVEVYVNGTKIVVLDIDEWRVIVDTIGVKP